jgi:uncharacterized protein YndB with AHSA1/START domain
MIETAAESIHVSGHFDNVTTEDLFDAWVKPEIMRKWLFIGPNSEITKIECDLRINGKFSILELEKSSGEYIDHFGKYLEINRPLQLVFTLSVPKHFPGETIVTIHIFPTLNGSELKLNQAGVSKEKAEKNWQEMFQKLKLVVEESVR